MTVASTSARSGPYTGTGATVAFPFTFKAMTAEEVAVYADGDLVSPSLYTVTLTAGGGTVTFTTAPASDVVIDILSDPDFTQEIGFSENGAFSAATHDEANDRAAVRDIVLKDRLDQVMPAEFAVADKAGKFLAFDAQGNPVTSSGTGADSGLRTDLAATGGALVAFTASITGATTRSVAAKLQERISLLDAPNLTDAERADILSGTNAIDITAKFKALMQDVHDNHPDAIVDCSMWRGSVTLTADPFEGMGQCKANLRTGSVTFYKNFNNGSITLPSFLDWEMSGTRFGPTSEITAILSDQSPAKGMLSTYVGVGLCSGTSGGNALTIDTEVHAANILTGSIIGIRGIVENTYVQHTLRASINASVTSFALDDAADVCGTLGTGNPAALGPSDYSLVYLKIGTEIVTGRVFNDGAVTNVTRGVNGTSAAPHTVGDTVTLMMMGRYTVIGASGTNCSIDGTLPMSITNAYFDIGSVNTRLSGEFTIDGAYTNESLAYQWLCLASTLSTRFRVEGNVVLRNAPHGGFMQMGCGELYADIQKIVDCTRPGHNLGAGIWDFGGGNSNVIKCALMDTGYLAVAIDNKSYGVPEYGLVGSPVGTRIEIGRLAGYEASVNITAAQDCYVRIGNPDGATGPVFGDSAEPTALQTTTTVPTTRNLVVFGIPSHVSGATGSTADDNYFIVEGKREYAPMYVSRMLSASAPGTTFPVNSTSYTLPDGVLSVWIDLDEFPATHFRVALNGLTNEAGQTVKVQLTAGGTAAHTGAQDATVTDALAAVDSGWLTRDDGKTGWQLYYINTKGSNATVDVTIRNCEIHWKIDP